MRKAQIDYKKGVRMTENTIGPIAISDATIDTVNEKAINCQGVFKSLVDATSDITGPQAGLLGCLVVSIAGVAGYGIYALCDLVKSGHPVELTSGGVSFAANTAALSEASSL